jgi:cysteine desulfurase
VRFSFSEFTTLEQIEYTLDTLREVLPMLRRFTRK